MCRCVDDELHIESSVGRLMSYLSSFDTDRTRKVQLGAWDISKSYKLQMQHSNTTGDDDNDDDKLIEFNMFNAYFVDRCWQEYARCLNGTRHTVCHV